MMWVDYNIDQVGTNFKVKGDWEGEVMGVAKDGTRKDHFLYKPGDVFIVNEHGWLCKTDELTTMLKKYEQSIQEKNANGSSTGD
jgi:hypothetical protein|tara:strand:+ start:275 stop:526 length:252 start_codon:yes stop_codon:yes gene_type:complete